MRKEKESLDLLIKTLGIEVVFPSACWLDSTPCPYGEPCGKFENRPFKTCHLREGGCRKLAATLKGSEFLAPVDEKATRDEYIRIKKGLDERRESASEFLENQAEVLLTEEEINKIEQTLLLTTAGIFKRLNRTIGDPFIVAASDNDLVDL